ncbi:MMPL family transporter, partial [Thermodesulfobacteriota bacterium]
WISNFKKTSRVYLDDRQLNTRMAGTNILYIELDTGAPDGIKDPSFLQRADRFLDAARQLDGVAGGITLMQIVKKMNLELKGSESIPGSAAAVAQYLMLLEGTTYERFWDYDYQKTNLILFFKKSDYRTGVENFPVLDSLLRKHLPGTAASYGGEVVLSYHWVNLLKPDQLKSFFTSLALIFLVSSLVFWSPRKGLIVTAPIVMAVAMNYGIMGFCGISLSVAVSITSSIIMGIGIDYAIHLQSKFDILSRTQSLRDALPTIFTTAGKAIIWNALVVIGGFGTLLLSQMPPNQKLGMICSLGIATSVIASFLVVPVLFVKKGGK